MNGKIRKNRNQIKSIVGDGTLRQILEKGYLSDTEIQFVIDAVYERIDGKKSNKKVSVVTLLEAMEGKKNANVDDRHNKTMQKSFKR